MGLRDTTISPEAQLADAIAEFYDDPLGYVMFAFPWDSERSIQLVKLDKRYHNRFHSEYGPDVWACEFLDNIGEEVRKRGFDGQNAVEPIQFSTASGHGIGKSVLVAWLIKWIADTRPYSKGVVTAGTADQLKTKTWAELGKWHKLSLTSHLYTYNTGRGAMSLARKGHEETWRCDAQTCKEENSESFAGLHAANSTPYYIFDEASAVPDKIFEVREGGTTDGEPMTFDFGNPTKNSGSFFENTQGKRRHRYITRCIDSRSVQITGKPRIKQWEEDYGEDSDFFKVRVKGEFPSAGSLQFIPTGDVLAAQQREVFVDKTAPLVLGVDVSRRGSDHCVIYPRIGMDARSFPPVRFRPSSIGLPTIEIAGRVIEVVRRFRALGREVNGIFVDVSGGYGGGVSDQLRSLGYPTIEVEFGGTVINKETYRYKSDEMWGRMRAAIQTRLAIIDGYTALGQRLKEELTQREFGITKKGQTHLETKEDLKDRLGEDASPDIADALCLTFAHEVAPLQTVLGGANEAVRFAKSDYDPYADAGA